MGQFIHRRNMPEGSRYRLWSTIVDAYVTNEGTREELVAYLRGHALEEFEREIVRRLERVDTRGTSEMGGTRDPDGPWDHWPPDAGEDEDFGG